MILNPITACSVRFIDSNLLGIRRAMGLGIECCSHNYLMSESGKIQTLPIFKILVRVVPTKRVLNSSIMTIIDVLKFANASISITLSNKIIGE